MKRIFIFIMLTILVLSGCSKLSNKLDEAKAEITQDDMQPPEEQEYKDKVIAALTAQDAETLKALFSKNARDNIEDFDFKIALLLRKYGDDEFISAKYDRRFPAVTTDEERGIMRIETYYVVETQKNGDKHSPRFMYIQVVTRNDSDPDDIGIGSMMYSPEIWEITMDDSNRGYYLWVDNPPWGDHIDPEELTSSENNE